MDTAAVLTMLKADLGELYPSPQRLEFLAQAVDAAISFITREGVELTSSVEDMQLVEMYAAYLVRKRATVEAMPRMLRWALNNRLFGQVGGGRDGGAT